MTVLKQYNTSTSTWDTVVVGQPGEPGIVTASTAPADTSVLWMDTADTASQVAIPSGGTAGQILAKTTGTDYATGWVNTHNRNVLINGAFDFWQRGTTSTTTFGYVADRWLFYRDGSGASHTHSQQAFTPGAAPVAGYEGQYFYRYSQTVAGTGGTESAIWQDVEDVRTFAGQTVTFSFWAKADAAREIKININQAFGSGGSPRAAVQIATATLSTSWQRYSFTYNVPSITGKTIGTTNYLQAVIFLPVNTTQTIDFWGMQLEAGSAATPFKRNAPSIQAELAACQRYYQRFGNTGSGAYNFIGMGPAYDSTNVNIVVPFLTEMRTTPTSIDSSANSTFLLENSGSYNTNNPVAVTLHTGLSTNKAGALNVQKSGSFNTGFTYKMQGYNTNSAYLGFSAELE